jgi:hypothetical protein
VGENFHSIGLCNDFLDKTPEIQITKHTNSRKELSCIKGQYQQNENGAHMMGKIFIITYIINIYNVYISTVKTKQTKNTV